MTQTDLEKILRDMLAKFNSETGTVHKLHEPTQLLRLLAQAGLPPQLLDMVSIIPVGKGIAGECVQKNRPVTICNLQTDTSGVAKPGAKQTGVGGAVCVPMHKNGAIIGTLGIGTMRQHEYTSEETQRLEELATLIAANLNT